MASRTLAILSSEGQCIEKADLVGGGSWVSVLG